MRLSVVSLLSTAVLVSLSQAEPVKLKLDRPSKVGDKAAITATATSAGSQKVTVAGTVVQSVSTNESAVLEATFEVLAVNGKGKATKEKYTVKSLKFSDKKGVAPKEILAGGKEVIAELKGDEPEFTVAGEPADEATAKALNKIIELNADNGPDSSFDQDAIFNTKVPHAAGEEWDADIAAAVNGAKKSGPYSFDAAGSSGKGRIEKLEKVAGTACAIFTGTLDLKLAAVTGVPEGSKLTDASFKMKITAPVPLDETTPDLGFKATVKVVVKADMPSAAGGIAKLDVVNEVVKEATIKLLP